MAALVISRTGAVDKQDYRSVCKTIRKDTGMRIEHRVPRKNEMRTALMNAGYTIIQWSHSDLVSVKKDKFNETFVSMRAAYNELIK